MFNIDAVFFQVIFFPSCLDAWVHILQIQRASCTKVDWHLLIASVVFLDQQALGSKNEQS